ncbi:MAG: helix-turn-helix domain-containing protein [Desulfurococcales archaeon]|nr:helix-turn-helix domain-containing protein [Desulfurococcales archaeon]
MKFVHLLGKRARERIIELLASSRSYSELANQLGISTAAISKYLSGKTHPSDAVLLRALDIATPEEKEVIINIILEEFAEGLKDLFTWASSESVLTREHLRMIESVIYEAYLRPPSR